MGTITHTHQTAIANDPSKDVSANVWNASHTFSLTAADVGVRVPLAADTTKNVPADFATLQLALAYTATIDFNGHSLTIQLANGTYTGQFFVPFTVGQAAAANLLIKGDATTPSNVVLTANVSFDGIVVVAGGARCRIQGVQFSGTNNTHGIFAQSASLVEFLNCDFTGSCFYHRYATGGSNINAIGNYSISGGVGGAHNAVEYNGIMNDATGPGGGNITVTLANTPAWGFGGYAYAGLGGALRLDTVSFAGTGATGTKFFAQLNGVINSGGTGGVGFPGGSAGSVTTGGQVF